MFVYCFVTSNTDMDKTNLYTSQKQQILGETNLSVMLNKQILDDLSYMEVMFQ